MHVPFNYYSLVPHLIATIRLLIAVWHDWFTGGWPLLQTHLSSMNFEPKGQKHTDPKLTNVSLQLQVVPFQLFKASHWMQDVLLIRSKPALQTHWEPFQLEFEHCWQTLSTLLKSLMHSHSFFMLFQASFLPQLMQELLKKNKPSPQRQVFCDGIKTDWGGQGRQNPLAFLKPELQTQIEFILLAFKVHFSMQALFTLSYPSLQMHELVCRSHVWLSPHLMQLFSNQLYPWLHWQDLDLLSKVEKAGQPTQRVFYM